MGNMKTENAASNMFLICGGFKQSPVFFMFMLVSVCGKALSQDLFAQTPFQQ